MSDSNRTVVDLFDSWFGGAATTIIAASIGRLMWHANEARSGRRKFFGWKALWEFPVVGGMVFIGEALSSYMQFSHLITVGVVTVLAYWGPRGTEALFLRWFGAKVEKE